MIKVFKLKSATPPETSSGFDKFRFPKAYRSAGDAGVNVVKLPLDYTLAQYLQSDGDQYIDTGVVPTVDIGCSVKFSYDLSSSEGGLIGVGSDEWRWGGPMCGEYGLQLSGLMYYGNSWVEYNVLQSNVPAVVDYNVNSSRQAYCDGVLVRDNIPAGSVTTSGTIYNFAYNYNGENYPWRNITAKEYFLKLYNGNTLIRNFVPCVRKSDSKPGLYDLCGSICSLTDSPFYVNSGSGEFTTG